MYKDINLMLIDENAMSRVKVWTLLGVLLGIIAAVGFVGVYLPVQERNRLRAEIERKEEEQRLYQEVETIFYDTSKQIQELRNINTIFTALKTKHIKMTDLFRDLQRNIPRSMRITYLSYQSEQIMLEGVSPSYRDISRFIVRLKMLDYVKDVAFQNARLVETGEHPLPMYGFSIQMDMDIGDELTESLDVEE